MKVVKRNNEIEERTANKNIRFIKSARIKTIGHVERKPVKGFQKGGSKRRPNVRWLHQIKDLKT